MRVILVSAVLGLSICLVGAGLSSARDGSGTQEGSATRSGPNILNGSSSPSGSALRNTQSRRTGRNLADQNKVRRLREGTVVTDAMGYFREDGDGASFVADSGFEFGTLPNLNLERVIRLLKGADAPSSIRWSVTGTVTEYAGRNYILLKRAVYKSSAPPPVPDRIASP